MVYLNSCIFVVDPLNANMVVIRMDNYRPTRPSSLSFNRWRLESSFAELSQVLKTKSDAKMSQESVLNKLVQNYSKLDSPTNLTSHNQAKAWASLKAQLPKASCEDKHLMRSVWLNFWQQN